jgi:hypothetical protein
MMYAMGGEVRRFFRRLYAGFIYDMKSRKERGSAEWKNPPPGGYEIPPWDPTLPKGFHTWGPPKKKRFTPWRR